MVSMAKGISIGRAARSPKVIRALELKAGRVRDYWESIAPVFGDLPPHRAAPPEGSAGDYKAAVKVMKITNPNGSVRFRVYDDDPKAHWIEYGTSHMPEYAPAAKTKEAFRK